MGVQRWGDPAWPGCSRASAADGSTMLQSNSHGSRVHSQTQFMGSVEKESFLSRRREELTRSRIAEVRKQESQQTKQSISKVKEEQARIREEERLLEEYRVFQEKERERERLEKEREEVLKAWRENQLRAEREEKEERDRKELEEKKRAIGLVKQRERGKEALEREEEARRAREKEEWDKRALKDKISREEAARAELAAKEAREREEKRRLEEQKRKLDEESDIRRMRGDVLNGYAAHRKRFGMKEFENSNSRVGGVGPLVVKEEDEDQEDAAVLAQEAATQQKFENEFKREREAVSRERARSREKLAFEREQLEKERTEMEKRSQAEKIKIEQAKVEMAREGERNRLIGMKQREEEAREEVKRQRRLEQDFENLFFGISREVGDEYLGERIAYQAFWKDPCEILYETKKTREWGPKNKKRDLNVPDLDKLVAERRVSRERSRESRDQSDPSRSRSPKVVVGPAGGRNTARTRSGLENDEEVSFHCTEVESEYGREQSYARQRLLEKYRGRDPRDSLEMTLSEDQSVMPRASGYGSLGTDMSRFLEEQERMIQRLERDRAELNKQIQQQENANRAVPRASEPFGDQNGSYEGGDAQNEEDLSGRVLYTNDVGRQPWMHMQDGHQAHTDEEEEEPEPRPEDDEILGKFLTFQPDSKWDTLGSQKQAQQPKAQTAPKPVAKPAASQSKKSGVRFDLTQGGPGGRVSPDLTYSDTEGELGVQQQQVARQERVGGIQVSRQEGRGEETKEQSRGRSREEALALRKKMMKYNPLEASGMAKKKASVAEGESGVSVGVETQPQQAVEEARQAGLPNPELLSRLARGEKATVTKDEMLKLTNKNYQNLPEVRRKEAERQRKEEAKVLREKQKLFGRELRSRSREATSPDKA